MDSKDLKQIQAHQLSEQQVSYQLEQLKKGFPFLRLKATASVGHGIMQLAAEDELHYMQIWDDYLKKGRQVVKFVPASGAASRMFKNLFAFLDADYQVPKSVYEKEFFEHIEDFAFYDALSNQCQARYGKDAKTLLEEGHYKEIVVSLVKAEGLNYGQFPKGLLLFHNDNTSSRTPMEEHLVEAALYARVNGEANIHFTVRHDHLALFQQRVDEVVERYAEKFNTRYHISFSEQKPSTDTIASNPDGTPFRNEDGSLLFRPGGHGALIENLNDIKADIVFIKNIDNVAPDRLKDDVVKYKKLLAGVLVTFQQQAFDYLSLLDTGEYNHEKLEEIIRFVQQTLCCRNEDIKHLEDAQLVIYLRKKLNRPMRVCGMVKNVGESGGGPFWAYNQDGTVSLQILESSQIDKNNPTYLRMFKEGTHFNPVDLVCAIRDYKGNAFHLPDYVDTQTGFISSKSQNGRELSALELPGLWNGAMSDWNTIFVEVPLSTFSPVKEVNDLLRPAHQ